MKIVKALPIICVVVFACLTGLKLGYVGDDSTVSFAGFFHFVRWLQRVDHGDLSAYLMKAWDVSDPTHTILWLSHVYHVRFSWGFVYPLLATLYAGVAELFRNLRPAETNYLEIMVQAGNVALMLHWLMAAAALGWALSRIRDLRLRALLGVAVTTATVFDYFVSNNFAFFNGHRLFVNFHDGFLYAMTLNVPRSPAGVILGLYWAARLLKAEGGRGWLIPVAFVFHLGVATMGCLVFFAAEALACAIRRERTRDLLVLGVCAFAGVLATAAFGSSGHHPASTAGLLPVGAILKVIVWHALAHPVPKYLIPVTIGALCLVAGIWHVRQERRVEVGRAFLVVAVMSGIFLVQFAAGHAVVARLLFWHDNPSVHSLLYTFGYSSSAILLGLSLWAFVRGGEWVAARADGRVHAFAATALVASGILLSVWLIGLTTSRRTQPAIHLVPAPFLAGEVFRQIWEPARWESMYAFLTPEGPAYPYLAFHDRRLLIGKSWIFNALVYLRHLHQSVVWGPVEGAPEMVPWAPQ